MHGACFLLLLLETLQLPLGAQAWAVLLHDEKKRPGPPATLTAHQVSADRKHRREPAATNRRTASLSPAQVADSCSRLRSWCTCYVFLSLRGKAILVWMFFIPDSISPRCLTVSTFFGKRLSKLFTPHPTPLWWDTRLGQIPGGQ